MDLIQKEEPQNITVQNICMAAQVNRTTFYAHYTDVCDLTEKCEIGLRASLKGSSDPNYALQFLRLMQENKDFYRLYFGYHKTCPAQNGPSQVWLQTTGTDAPSSPDRYRLVFYQAGIDALLAQWVEQGCMDPPEKIQELLVQRLPDKIF